MKHGIKANENNIKTCSILINGKSTCEAVEVIFYGCTNPDARQSIIEAFLRQHKEINFHFPKAKKKVQMSGTRNGKLKLELNHATA